MLYLTSVPESLGQQVGAWCWVESGQGLSSCLSRQLRSCAVGAGVEAATERTRVSTDLGIGRS